MELNKMAEQYENQANQALATRAIFVSRINLLLLFVFTAAQQLNCPHLRCQCTTSKHIFCVLSVKQNEHTTSCSKKWLAPWASAAVGPRLPSQCCLILMQVNPTLTSSSPPWPIISPPLPLFPTYSLIFSHPCLPSLTISSSPSSLYPLYSPYLSLSLFLSSAFDPTLPSLFLSPPQSCLKEISKPIRQQF